MSFYRLAGALSKVDLAAISEIELVKIIRSTMNENLPASNINYVTLNNAIIIARALKSAYTKGWSARGLADQK